MHLVARDRPQEIGHTQIVVQSEIEELGGLQERGNGGVGFEISRQRADEVLLRLEPLLFGRAISNVGFTPARIISGPGTRLASSELKT